MRRAEITSLNKDALFSSSIMWYIIVALAIFAFFVISGSGNLGFNSDIVWKVTPFVIAGGELYIAYRAFSFRVRKATFYDDRFEVVRRFSKRIYHYAQIKRVNLVKGIWLGDSIVLSLIEEEEPLTILRNPKNPSLKIDLYNWLKQKLLQNNAPVS